MQNLRQRNSPIEVLALGPDIVQAITSLALADTPAGLFLPGTHD